MARPNLRPMDVYGVLKDAGARSLFHANTVTTSTTFLQQGALLSRSFVERRGLKQTAQASDVGDQRYGIWNSIFLDHVDIHERGGRARGPNAYGPVLFVFDLEILRHLPEATTVNVTRSNPMHWYKGQSVRDRWYPSRRELKAALNYGDFDKMLVIRTSTGKLQFPTHRVQIELDHPSRQLGSRCAFARGQLRLRNAALSSGRCVPEVTRHSCRADCICEARYSALSESEFKRLFK